MRKKPALTRKKNKKTVYQKPALRRHGNLRFLTQME